MLLAEVPTGVLAGLLLPLALRGPPEDDGLLLVDAEAA